MDMDSGPCGQEMRVLGMWSVTDGGEEAHFLGPVDVSSFGKNTEV